MGSLNVTVIILLDGTFIALFKGSILVMVGDMVSVALLHVKLVIYGVIRLFPVRSVMLFAGMVRVYFTFFNQL